MATGNESNEKHEEGSVPLAIWPVAQVSAQLQRAGRYHPESSQHAGKMLPALAARIVSEYSQPGDLVVDPMCGIGTTLVEGSRLGRRCVGIELEERWTALSEENSRLGLDADAALPTVRRGDARDLARLLGDATGSVDLVVVSPPYACDTGVIARLGAGSGGICKRETLNYSADKANLGHARGPAYEQAMAQVYAACLEVLRPGGLLVTVTKNTRRRGRCYDLAGTTVRLAEGAGFRYLQHVVALLGPIREGSLTGRPSFWQIIQTQKARARGEPAHLVVHEDVCVLQKPGVAQ